MRRLHVCVEETDRSNITVKERGRKANFRNPNRDTFKVAKVDGCLVKDGKRADWIVTAVGVGSVIVELKGKDVAHASEQLFATLRHDECAKWLERRRSLLVICSRVPSFDATVAKAQIEARKAGVRFKAVCNSGDFDLAALLPV